MLKKVITEFLNTAIQNCNYPEVLPQVNRPENPQHGDYTTNVCLVLAGLIKQNPLEIAKKLQEEIIQYQTQSKTPVIKTIEIASPGFLNFFINEADFISQVNRVLTIKGIEFFSHFHTAKADKTTSKSSQKQSGIAASTPASRADSRSIGDQANQRTDITAQSEIDRQNGQLRVVVEFTDPNPFKEFHVGHLYSNTVGESLSRLLEASGHIVRRVNYQGDVGLHVAKALWGLQKKLSDDKLQISDLETRPLTARVQYMGAAYAVGAAAYDDPSEVGKQAQAAMQRLNTAIFIVAQELHAQETGRKPRIDYRRQSQVDEKELASIREFYVKGRQWSLEYFETIYKRLGTSFDGLYFEGAVGEVGVALVEDHIDDGIFERSEGAVVYRGEKDQSDGSDGRLHTRVFVNSLGLPTYEAKELGLAPVKEEDWTCDRSIIVTGSEIDEYFAVLLSAMAKIRPDLARKTTHIGHGMVRLPSGKMSSRTGTVLTGEWLIDEVKQHIFTILDQNATKYSKQERENIAEITAIAAIKYSLLKVGLPSNISFDIDKSVSFAGDSGPYLQYTYARCKSILRKHTQTEDNNREDYSMYIFDPVLSKQTISQLPEEQMLLRQLVYFLDIVSEAAKRLTPNTICTYLYAVASDFNLLYAKAEILGNPFRLFLTAATAKTINMGLYLLGIQTLERM